MVRPLPNFHTFSSTSSINVLISMAIGATPASTASWSRGYSEQQGIRSVFQSRPFSIDTYLSQCRN
jgi:hypothetical protein